MKQEREDMVAPDLPPPNKLTHTEQRAVYRYLKQGADKHALASYFNTSWQEITGVERLGELQKWK
jgi:hypothetical protein